MLIYDPPKNPSTYEVYLDKAIEARIENCSPPPPKPKHHRVFHLTALSPPPPAENTKCPCDKIAVLQIAIFLAFCSHYTYQFMCALVWVCDDYKTLNKALPCSPIWWPPCWEVGDCNPPPPLAHCEYRSCSTVKQRRATKNSAAALSSRNNMISIHQRSAGTNEGKTTLI